MALAPEEVCGPLERDNSFLVALQLGQDHPARLEEHSVISVAAKQVVRDLKAFGKLQTGFIDWTRRRPRCPIIVRIDRYVILHLNPSSSDLQQPCRVEFHIGEPGTRVAL